MKIQKLINHGNSYYLSVNASIRSLLKWRIDDQFTIELTEDGKGLIVRKVEKARSEQTGIKTEIS